MEDLWIVQNSAIEAENFADMVEYKRYLERFNKEEEKRHQSRLLYGVEDKKA
jgi:hypothetical protein